MCTLMINATCYLHLIWNQIDEEHIKPNEETNLKQQQLEIS